MADGSSLCLCGWFDELDHMSRIQISLCDRHGFGGITVKLEILRSFKQGYGKRRAILNFQREMV